MRSNRTICTHKLAFANKTRNNQAGTSGSAGVSDSTDNCHINLTKIGGEVQFKKPIAVISGKRFVEGHYQKRSIEI
jgi:hypothetical protein